jgi:hypothetical protein
MRKQCAKRELRRATVLLAVSVALFFYLDISSGAQTAPKRALAAVTDVQTDTYTVQWPADTPSDVMVSAAMCKDRAYLLTTPRLGTVRVVDMSTRQLIRSIGTVGNGPQQLRDPVGVAVDCQRRILYVVQVTRDILSFSAEDGSFLRSYLKPATFLPTAGGAVVLSSDGSRLYIGGLWSQQELGFMKNPKVTLYSGVRFGWELSLTDENSTAMFLPVDKGCIATQNACTKITFDHLVGGDGWVVGQPGTPKLGFYDDKKELKRVVNISSPHFLRDGTILTNADTLDREQEWARRNSIVMSVAAFGNLIGVVHAHQAGTTWHRGEPIQFEQFLNVMSSDGTMLRADIPLPGLPVGHDEHRVLVVDYGKLGRRPDFREFSLLGVRVSGVH